MSLKKLTLTIDAQAIEKGRRYSSEHNTSISRLVTHFLSSLPSEERRYSPTVERLLGILPTDVDIDDYHRHLDEKYGK